MSSSQNERTLGEGEGGAGGGVARKRTKANKGGEGESKLGNPERTYFLNVPYQSNYCQK